MMTEGSGDSLVEALSKRHQDLVTQHLDTATSKEKRANFIAELMRAGADVPPGDGRDALRNMLYFWAGDQVSRAERDPSDALPALAPYAKPIDVAVEVSAITSSRDPPDASTPSAFSAGTTRRNDAVDVERELRARAILRIAALARQWRLTKDVDAKIGYLLSGKALQEASLYKDDDPDILALVRASEERVLHTRRVSQAIGAVVIALVIAGLIVIVLKERATIALLAEYNQRIEEEKEASEAAEASSAQERDRLRAEARASVDALSHDNFAPLKSFLETHGDAVPAQVDRLRLAPASLEILQNTSIKPRARSVAPTAASGLWSAGECAGFLWLGNATDSRLSDHRDPLALQSGDAVTLDNRDDIRLRSNWPDRSTYAMAPQNGLVPAGGVAKVTGKPQGFDKTATGSIPVQVWAPVTVPATYCTTVYIQYFGSEQKLPAIVAALGKIDVQTPTAEQIVSAKDLAEVRYFFEQQKAVAQLVAKQVASFRQGNALKVVPLLKFPAKPANRGTIELWLDLSQ